ncbi:UNVERIFIED_CONTAM: Retrovirus-related Pol polyprotein from transposon RE1 [Sesamum latifolium]|uniref:Retrovirus-related Pol polyprotein from transposon RE1 n=1 Tax=Sesamum latifolium TaxID=2727402 RepID=A0AAW2Y6A1_9LAMI
MEAMNKEILALETNNTWEVTALPPGKRAISCKCVYKLKLKDDGTIDRYKARLDVKGYNQVEGVHYVDNFSPVVKAATVRLFLAFAAPRNWNLHLLDINNAFLHGHLDEEIYMHPPECYHVESISFCQSSHDHCLFTRGSGTNFLALLVYVDDVLFTGSSLTLIIEVKAHLDKLFIIKDLGVAKYFLGLQIARSPEGLSLTQTKYITVILVDTGLQMAKSPTSPLPQGVKFSTDVHSPLLDPEPYRRLVGRLLYLGLTRSDIAHAVQQLSQFLHHPCDTHWYAALHIVHYLKGTSHMGLFFPSSNSLALQAYCDADWTSCSNTRRSLTGFCIFLGGALVSWKTKKQAIVSRSSTEVEYRAMAATVCELHWLSYLVRDFQLCVPVPVPLFCDNKAALHIAANSVFHERTKHIDIDCNVVRNQYKSGLFLPSYVRSCDQLADLFTKNLSEPSFLRMLSKLDLFSLAPGPTCGEAVGLLTEEATPEDVLQQQIDHDEQIDDVLANDTWRQFDVG